MLAGIQVVSYLGCLHSISGVWVLIGRLQVTPTLGGYQGSLGDSFN